MAKAPGKLYLKQSRSDFEAAERFGDTEPSMFCHAIAKYQQAVEKSIKGLLLSLQAKGIVNAEPILQHDLEHELNALTRVPFKRGHEDIAAKVSKLMNTANRSEIRALCCLAPQKPDAAGLQNRNTEYPFQRMDGTWLTPSDDNAFTEEELKHFRLTASSNLSGVSRILTVLERM